MLARVIALAATLCLWAVPSFSFDPPPLSAYGDLPAVEDMAIAPSGNGLAFIAKIKGKRRLVVTDGAGKMLTSANIDDLKVRKIYWPHDNVLWLYMTDTQNLGFGFTTRKHEFARAILVYPKTGNMKVVFEKQRKIYEAIWGYYGTRMVDGRLKAYFSGIELDGGQKGTKQSFKHGRPGLYEVDLRNNSARKKASPPPERHFRDWLVGPDGEVAATLKVDSKDGEWRIENADYQTIVSGVSNAAAVNLIAFGPDGSSLIYAADDPATNQIAWYQIPLAGGQSQEILSGERIEEIYVHHRTGAMIGFFGGAGVPRAHFFDPDRQAVIEKLHRAFSKHAIQILHWTHDFTKFLILRRGNGDSGTYYRVDMETLKAEPMGYERPLIMPRHVGPISKISYTASDGMEMDGILTLPPHRQPQNLPLVMLPHGGPHAHDTATFDWWAQAFASRGYAVFQPNFRGSTNRDEAFRVAGYGEWGRKMQTDISDGLAALVQQGIVDPQRVCIMGGSYGGYAALVGVTLQQGLYRCAVAVAPVVDLELHLDNRMHASNYNRAVKYGWQQTMGDRARFDEVSPLVYAERADAPILLIHGKDDTVVQFKHSEKMARALTRARKPHLLVTLDEEDHWLSHASSRQKMLHTAMDFIQTHNPAE